ncbi:MAG: type I 3-dehydroquinate dehydratase [Treponema sp.]|nr:type I 3-dehydroquinate dehydratase [Treponema sp.]
MSGTLLCLTLSGRSIEENVRIAHEYSKYVDLYELRADFLAEEELLNIRRFPSLVELPVILTIRRRIDGGQYKGGEANRTMLFGRALAFADENPRNNFAYVDFEDDFRISSLQDAAMAFGTHIIRSVHNMQDPVFDIPKKLKEMRKTGYEIPKIACTPHNLSDLTRIFNECEDLRDYDHIVTAMGHVGLPSRILASRLHSYLTFVSPRNGDESLKDIGHIDAITMQELYHFKQIKKDTKIYGITGWPLTHTSSPQIHNDGYKKHDLNAVYIPIPSDSIEEAVAFANQVGIKGLSITVPHKETVLPLLSEKSQRVQQIGSCNTIVKGQDGWSGYNTDAVGIEKALQNFLGVKDLKRYKVSIIGAGGAAKAVAYAVKKLGGKACVFNRTIAKARLLAEKFDFKYAVLAPESTALVEKYSNLIIQTTSKGMGKLPPSTEDNDPLWFYEFTGKEKVFDIVYVPETTPILWRAKNAGCTVSNGMPMLKIQGYEQFKLFTGVDYF